MRIALIIAADSVRALLRQRLLLGLMLIALALIGIFSTGLIAQRKMVTRTAIDRNAAEAPATADAHKAGSPANKNGLSRENQQRLNEQMDSVSSTFQALLYQVASFGGSLVALFIFSTGVTTEIRKGTIRITLTKPVSRTQFLLGKFLGGIAVMAGYALIASVMMILFARLGGLQLSPAIKYAPWLMFCRQLMLGSLAMLLSLFVHPFVASVLAFFAGNGFYSRANPLFYLLPSYEPFNTFGAMLQGNLMSAREVWLLSGYALDFVILMLLLALWRFRSKELV